MQNLNSSTTYKATARLIHFKLPLHSNAHAPKLAQNLDWTGFPPYIHPSIHPSMHACMHTYTHPSIHPSIHPCMHTSLATYLPTWLYRPTNYVVRSGIAAVLRKHARSRTCTLHLRTTHATWQVRPPTGPVRPWRPPCSTGKIRGPNQ